MPHAQQEYPRYPNQVGTVSTVYNDIINDMPILNIAEVMISIQFGDSLQLVISDFK